MNNISGESFNTFGEMLRYLRVREHMTQCELAIAVGYSDAHINRLEKGLRQPDPDVVSARFIHALRLKNQPETATRLIELAQGSKPLNSAASTDDNDLDNTREIASSALKHNLPAPTTELVGRSADVEAVIRLLTRNQQSARLITLIGPPGIGKTRLALQVGWDALNDFPDGVRSVPLASVDESRYVANTLVQTLNVHAPSLPPEAALRGYFQDKHLLLILDNFEQLLGDDDHSEATTLVADLLAHAPALKMIITSRAALRVQGEHLYPVPQLAASSAVELFSARAQAMVPAFTVNGENAKVIAEICQRLDHLPLAIELAAARVRMFEPTQLLARLSTRLSLLTDGARDLPPRQRTLRNTIEWSYNLLSPEEQTLFRRLGIFAGGCTLEAVEKVASEELHIPVLDLLQSLADKSMIKLEAEAGETRVALLEMLREYALEQLIDKNEMDELASRHAEYYVAYAEHISSLWNTSTPMTRTALLKRLEREDDNLRATFAHARRTNNNAMMGRVIVAALTERVVRSPETENWIWLPTFIKWSRTSQPRLLHAKMLLITATIHNNQRESGQQTRVALEEALAIFEELNERQLSISCLIDLGWLAWSQGEYAHGLACLNHGLQLFREGDYPLLYTHLQVSRATILRDQGEFERAAALFNESGNSYERYQRWFSLGLLQNGMGDLEFDRGNFDAANKHYENAHAAFRQESSISVYLPMRGLGRITYVNGDLESADTMLSKSVENAREWQSVSDLQWILHHAGFVKHLTGDDASAQSLMHEGLQIQHRSLYRLCIAESYERFAWIAADKRHPQRAATLLGAAHALRQWMGAAFPLGDKPPYDRYLAMTRAGLNEDAFNQAWAAGEQMTLDETVAFALEI